MEGPDLFSLLAQLIALKQEVNLQTKATRAQQEQNAATLAQLSATTELLRQAQAAAAADGKEKLRPLLKTLVELYDALMLAEKELRRIQDEELPALQQTVAAEPEDRVLAMPEETRWSRWFGFRSRDTSFYRETLEAQRSQRAKQAERTREGLAKLTRIISSLSTGYAMSLRRVERAFKQHGLEPISTTGQSFNPERMEVVEAVTGSAAPPGEVLAEVQRGYLWQGQVFRYAQVRVSKA